MKAAFDQVNKSNSQITLITPIARCNRLFMFACLIIGTCCTVVAAKITAGTHALPTGIATHRGMGIWCIDTRCVVAMQLWTVLGVSKTEEGNEHGGK